MNQPNNLEATVFVYRCRETKAIRCEYVDGACLLQNSPAWEHVATLEPRLWIQAHFDEVAQ